MLKIDTDYLTEILTEMVKINSCNPDMTAGSPGEAALGAYIADQLRAFGVEPTTHPIKPARVNVVGTLRGSGDGRSLMLNAHMDTVGVAGMPDPFSAEIKVIDGQKRLYGRGSQDMKGSLAAMLAALKAIQDSGQTLSGDVIFTAVADEEYVSIGTEDLIKHYSADAAIVTEPTDMTICRAHRGFAWFEVITYGRAAHGSRYLEGIDANMRMGRFLAELDKLEQALRSRHPHPLTAVPSLHASQLQGGSEISIYSDRCTLNIERRLNPGETIEQAMGELQTIIDKLSAEDDTFKADLKMYFMRSPFEVSAETKIVETLEQALIKHTGSSKPHMGATFWTDAALLADAGIETVVLGPVGAGLHSAEEWVDVDSCVDLAKVLVETAMVYCA